jgi:O-acetyl-ADP-ribose deacetylase (regulator of RNase III)
VGPVWNGGAQGEDELLASAYRSCMRIAVAHGLSSLAFPAISCGAYRFPAERAASIAIRTVREDLRDQRVVKRVVFAVRETAVEAAFRRRLEATA